MCLEGHAASHDSGGCVCKKVELGGLWVQTASVKKSGTRRRIAARDANSFADVVRAVLILETFINIQSQFERTRRDNRVEHTCCVWTNRERTLVRGRDIWKDVVGVESCRRQETAWAMAVYCSRWCRVDGKSSRSLTSSRQNRAVESYLQQLWLYHRIPICLNTLYNHG